MAGQKKAMMLRSTTLETDVEHPEVCLDLSWAQGDDMAPFQARYVAPAGANIVKPPNPTLRRIQMSEHPEGLLGSLMGQGDDMSAFRKCTVHTAPTGAECRQVSKFPLY
jgi:hypothetical protein